MAVACGGATDYTCRYTNGLSGGCNISGSTTSTLGTIPNACGGDVTETWNDVDACGNALHATRTIHINAATAPTYSAHADITVACGGATTHSLSYTNG